MHHDPREAPRSGAAQIAWALLLLIGLFGCPRDFELPPAPRTCNCEFGLCENGVCKESRCVTTDQCRWGSCVDGACLATVCQENAQCEFGQCEAGGCDERLCSTAANCRGGVTCTSGRCDALGCSIDSQCSFGLCRKGACDTTVCAVDTDCSAGICVSGSCDSTSCRVDADCVSADFICEGATPTSLGTCALRVEGAPLTGDPNALRMTDNLDNAWTYVRARHPTAVLVQIVGLGLKADGTVDVLADYSSRWMYGFREGDGQTATPNYVTITYLLQAGSSVGAYEPAARNVTLDTEIPEATWRTFLDATVLTANATGASCALQVGDSGDSIVYSQQVPDPHFIWSNWKGQSVIGDPVTGNTTYVGCP